MPVTFSRVLGYAYLSPAIGETPCTFSRVLGYAWGMVSPVCCTLALWPLRQHLGSSSQLLIYLLGVFLVATRHGRGASFLASLLSAAAFAYFFAPPIFSLAVSDTGNIIGLGVMLIVAHVTSSLMEKLRLQADIAAQRERRAAALYRLGEALSGARREDEVVATAVSHIEAEFGVPASLLFLNEGDPRCGTMPRAEGALCLPLEASEGRIGMLALPSALAARLAEPELKTFLDMVCKQIAQALERIRLAEQARQASVQAEAEALRNSLLSAISHDLRTPLTRIMGAAGILAERETSLDSEERIDFKRAILDEAERMSDLMSKILDMARIATGTIAPQREWNAIEEVVGGTLARLDKALADRPVNISLPGDLPLVWMDAVLVQQVLTNLVENAIKYTPPGSPIDISAKPHPPEIWLEVADRGPGIPMGLEDRLFDKFYRLEAESPQTGVGLGLSLCRAIAQAHGGSMVAANRQGGGAVFTLSLPLREPPAMVREEESPP